VRVDIIELATHLAQDAHTVRLGAVVLEEVAPASPVETTDRLDLLARAFVKKWENCIFHIVASKPNFFDEILVWALLDRGAQTQKA
jgi:hypothetical protein